MILLKFLGGSKDSLLLLFLIRTEIWFQTGYLGHFMTKA